MADSKTELVALSTVKAFNNLVHQAATKGSETLALMWKAGEVAKNAKAALPHGRWGPFVEQYYDVNHRSVTRWIKFHESVPEIKLDTVSNLTAGIKMLDLPKGTTQSGEEGRMDADGTEPQEETAPTPPGSGKENRGGDLTASDLVAEAAAEEPEEEPTIEEIVDGHNKTIESFCRDLRKKAKTKPEGIEWLDHKGRWDGYFRKVCQGLDTLRSAKAVVCPKCEGATCKECDGHGYLPKIEAEGGK